MTTKTPLTKLQVFDHMIDGDLESARFLKNPESNNKVVIEVFMENGDLQWQEVWDNERSGCVSFPLKSKDTYLLVGDDDSSEKHHD